MKNRSITYLLLFGICSMLTIMQSCRKTDNLEADINSLKDRVAALEKATEGLNTSFASLQALMQKNKIIIGITPTKDGLGYLLELSDGTNIKVMESEAIQASVPEFSVDEEGYWIYKTSSDTDFKYLSGANGEKVSAWPRDEEGNVVATPLISVSASGYWQVSYDNGQTYTSLGTKAEGGSQGGTSIFSKVEYNEANHTFSFTLPNGEKTYTFPVDDTFGLIIYGLNDANNSEQNVQVFAPDETHKEYKVEQNDVQQAVVQAPKGWNVLLSENLLTITPQATVVKDVEETIKIVLTSSKNYIRIVSIEVKQLSSEAGAKAWQQFVNADQQNVLLDFSYAGYKYGEMAPPEIETLMAQGYKIYDVTDPKYGAIPDDGKSDRAAFMKVLEEIASQTKQEDLNMTDRYIKENAKAIIYFPEGNYILQDETSQNRRIRISMSDIVLKGAGRNKTTLEMTMANTSPEPIKEMWNSPVMMEFKHNTGLGTPVGSIAEDAPIGSKTITASLTGVSAGSWVCLVLGNTDNNVINSELYPHKWEDIKIQQGGTPNIKTKGIQIYEYHQIERINGNNVTFKEPIMHAINKDWGWKVHKFANYANVGVEDLTFKGYAKEKFIHHGSDIDDGGFKLIDFVRLTNSWICRVNFESVSEAMSIASSANCSAYDITIGGNLCLLSSSVFMEI